MTSIHIQELDAIAAVGSTKKKQEMLAAFMKSGDAAESTFRCAIIQAALDPFMMFGIKETIPPATVFNIQGDPRSYFMGVLEKLANRMVTGNIARGLAGTVHDVELIERILRKDLRCGVGITMALKVHPKLFKVFKVARADVYEEGVPLPLYQSPKIDGLRCMAVVSAGTVKFYSRNGLEINSLDHTIPDLLRLDNGNDHIYDCEATDGEIFNESMSGIRTKDKEKHTNTGKLHVFDVLTMREYERQEGEFSQADRLFTLDILFKGFSSEFVVLLPHVFSSTHEEITQRNATYWDAKLEGSILKKPEAVYHFGKSKNWLKIKGHQTWDVEVIGKEEGEGKYVGTLGALIVKLKGVEFKIGSGFSDEERDAFWANLPEVIEVSGQELTPDGKIRHGVFERVRLDLTVEGLDK